MEKLLLSKDNILTFIKSLLMVAVVLIAVKIILAVISKHTAKIIERENQKQTERSKHIITSMTLLRSVARYLIYVIAIMFLLRFFGYGDLVNSVVVTAGIGGLIISLGAQSFIKDIISGLFILFEKQYAVGDYVEIGGKEGKVIAISVRSTYLDYRGQKVIVPNGQIDIVVNYTNRYNVFRFEVPTAYEADTAAVIKVLEEILDDYYQTHKDIFIKPPEVLGVSEFAESSVNILIQGRCKTLKHYEAEREVKQKIKEGFDVRGIEIPYNKLVVYNKEN